MASNDLELALRIRAAFEGQQALTNLATSFVDVNKRIENLQRGLQALTGSTEGAAQEFEYLEEVSRKFGLSILDLADNYVKLSASAKETNLEGEATRKIFEATASTMAVLGGDTIQTERAFRALGQMMSKGQIYAEELKGQLAEAIPGAIQIMSRSLGIATTDLLKLMEAGQLGSDVLLPFATQLEKEYGSLASSTTTFTQAINRIRTEWNLLMKQLGDTGAWNAITSTLDLLGKSSGALAGILGGGLGLAIFGLIKGIGGWIVATQASVVAMTAQMGAAEKLRAVIGWTTSANELAAKAALDKAKKEEAAAAAAVVSAKKQADSAALTAQSALASMAAREREVQSLLAKNAVIDQHILLTEKEALASKVVNQALVNQTQARAALTVAQNNHIGVTERAIITNNKEMSALAIANSQAKASLIDKRQALVLSAERVAALEAEVLAIQNGTTQAQLAEAIQKKLLLQTQVATEQTLLNAAAKEKSALAEAKYGAVLSKAQIQLSGVSSAEKQLVLQTTASTASREAASLRAQNAYILEQQALIKRLGLVAEDTTLTSINIATHEAAIAKYIREVEVKIASNVATEEEILNRNRLIAAQQANTASTLNYNNALTKQIIVEKELGLTVYSKLDLEAKQAIIELRRAQAAELRSARQLKASTQNISALEAELVTLQSVANSEALLAGKKALLATAQEKHIAIQERENAAKIRAAQLSRNLADATARESAAIGSQVAASQSVVAARQREFAAAQLRLEQSRLELLAAEQKVAASIAEGGSANAVAAADANATRAKERYVVASQGAKIASDNLAAAQAKQAASTVALDNANKKLAVSQGILARSWGLLTGPTGMIALMIAGFAYMAYAFRDQDEATKTLAKSTDEYTESLKGLNAAQLESVNIKSADQIQETKDRIELLKNEIKYLNGQTISVGSLAQAWYGFANRVAFWQTEEEQRTEALSELADKQRELAVLEGKRQLSLGALIAQSKDLTVEEQRNALLVQEANRDYLEQQKIVNDLYQSRNKSKESTIAYGQAMEKLIALTKTKSEADSNYISAQKDVNNAIKAYVDLTGLSEKTVRAIIEGNTAETNSLTGKSAAIRDAIQESVRLTKEEQVLSAQIKQTKADLEAYTKSVTSNAEAKIKIAQADGDLSALRDAEISKAKTLEELAARELQVNEDQLRAMQLKMAGEQTLLTLNAKGAADTQKRIDKLALEMTAQQGLIDQKKADVSATQAQTAAVIRANSLISVALESQQTALTNAQTELANLRTSYEALKGSGVAPLTILNALLAEIASKEEEVAAATQTMSVSLTAAFKNVGVDLEEVNTGMDFLTRQMIDSFVVAGKSAQSTAETIQASFTDVLSKANTETELNAIKAGLNAIGAESRMSSQALSAALAQVNEKLVDVKGAVDPVQQAMEKLGTGVPQKLDAVAASFENAFNTIRDSGAPVDEVQQAFMSYAESALLAAENGGKLISPLVRQQSEALGLGQAFDELVKQVKETNLVFEAINTRFDETAERLKAQQELTKAQTETELAALDVKLAMANLLGNETDQQALSIEMGKKQLELTKQTIAADESNLKLLADKITELENEKNSLQGISQSQNDLLTSLKEELPVLQQQILLSKAKVQQLIAEQALYENVRQSIQASIDVGQRDNLLRIESLNLNQSEIGTKKAAIDAIDQLNVVRGHEEQLIRLSSESLDNSIRLAKEEYASKTEAVASAKALVEQLIASKTAQELLDPAVQQAITNARTVIQQLEDQARLSGLLVAAKEAEKQAIEDAAASLGLSVNTYNTLDKTLSRLGLNIREVFKGMDLEFEKNINGLKELAKESNISSTAIRDGFVNLLKDASTEQELLALRDLLIQFRDTGKLSVNDVAAAFSDLQKKLKSAKTDIDPLTKALEELGVGVPEKLRLLEESAKSAFDLIKANNLPVNAQREALLAYAKAAVISANANQKMIDPSVRLQAESLGIVTAYDQLVISLQQGNQEFEAIAQAIDQANQKKEQLRATTESGLRLLAQEIKENEVYGELLGDLNTQIASSIVQQKNKIALSERESVVLRESVDEINGKIESLEKEALSEKGLSDTQKVLLAQLKQEAIQKQNNVKLSESNTRTLVAESASYDTVLSKINAIIGSRTKDNDRVIESIQSTMAEIDSRKSYLDVLNKNVVSLENEREARSLANQSTDQSIVLLDAELDKKKESLSIAQTYLSQLEATGVAYDNLTPAQKLEIDNARLIVGLLNKQVVSSGQLVDSKKLEKSIIEQIAKSVGLSVDRYEEVNAAMTQLGLNTREQLLGMDVEFEKSIQTLDSLRNAADVSAETIKTAFIDLLEGANTEKELQVLRELLVRIKEDGRLSINDLLKAFADLDKKVKETKESVSPIIKAFKDLGVVAPEQLQLVAQSAKDAFELLSKNNIPLDKQREILLAYAEAALRSANATGTLIDPSIRLRAESLGVAKAYDELVLSLQEGSVEFKAIADQQGRVKTQNDLLRASLEATTKSQEQENASQSAYLLLLGDVDQQINALLSIQKAKLTQAENERQTLQGLSSETEGYIRQLEAQAQTGGGLNDEQSIYLEQLRQQLIVQKAAVSQSNSVIETLTLEAASYGSVKSQIDALIAARSLEQSELVDAARLRVEESNAALASSEALKALTFNRESEARALSLQQEQVEANLDLLKQQASSDANALDLAEKYVIQLENRYRAAGPLTKVQIEEIANAKLVVAELQRNVTTSQLLVEVKQAEAKAIAIAAKELKLSVADYKNLSVVSQQLGIDLREAMTGMDAETERAINAFKELGEKGNFTAQTLQKAFDHLLGQANTEKELNALADQWTAMGDEGRVSLGAVALGLAEIRKKMVAVKGETDPLVKSLALLGVDVPEQMQAVANELEKAFLILQQNQGTIDQQQTAFLKYAESALRAANATGSAVDPHVRLRAEMLGLTAVLEELDRGLQSQSAEFIALGTQLDRVIEQKRALREIEASALSVTAATIDQTTAYQNLMGDYESSLTSVIDAERLRITVAEQESQSLQVAADAAKNKATQLEAILNAELAQGQKVSDQQKEQLTLLKQEAELKQQAADRSKALTQQLIIEAQSYEGIKKFILDSAQARLADNDRLIESIQLDQEAIEGKKSALESISALNIVRGDEARTIELTVASMDKSIELADEAAKKNEELAESANQVVTQLKLSKTAQELLDPAVKKQIENAILVAALLGKQAELSKILADAKKAEKQAIEQAAKASNLSVEEYLKVDAALNRVGLDTREVFQGMDIEFQRAVTGLGELSQQAGVTGAALQQAFTNLLGQANTEKEIEALRQAFERMGSEGKVNADLVRLGLSELEIKAIELKSATDPVQVSLARLGQGVPEQLLAVAKANEVAYQVLKKSKVAVDDVDQAFLNFATSALVAAEQGAKVDLVALKTEASARGLSAAYDELRRSLQETNPEFAALITQIDRTISAQEKLREVQLSNIEVTQSYTDTQITLANLMGDYSSAIRSSIQSDEVRIELLNEQAAALRLSSQAALDKVKTLEAEAASGKKLSDEQKEALEEYRQEAILKSDAAAKSELLAKQLEAEGRTYEGLKGKIEAATKASLEDNDRRIESLQLSQGESDARLSAIQEIDKLNVVRGNEAKTIQLTLESLNTSIELSQEEAAKKVEAAESARNYVQELIAQKTAQELLDKEVQKEIANAELVAVQLEKQASLSRALAAAKEAERVAIELAAKEVGLSVKEYLKIDAILTRLGLNTREVFLGMDADFERSLNSLEALGQQAGVTSGDLQKAFTDVLSKANTITELDELARKLESLGQQSKLSGDQVAQGLAEIEVKSSEVKAALDPVQVALEKLGIGVPQRLKAIADQNKVLYESVKASKAPIDEIDKAFLKYAESQLLAAEHGAKVDLAAIKNEASVRGLGAAFNELQRGIAEVDPELVAFIQQAERYADQIARTNQLNEAQRDVQRQVIETQKGIAEIIGDKNKLAGEESRLAEQANQDAIQRINDLEEEKDAIDGVIQKLIEEQKLRSLTPEETDTLKQSQDAAQAKQLVIDKAREELDLLKKRAEEAAINAGPLGEEVRLTEAAANEINRKVVALEKELEMKLKLQKQKSVDAQQDLDLLEADKELLNVAKEGLDADLEKAVIEKDVDDQNEIRLKIADNLIKQAEQEVKIAEQKVEVAQELVAMSKAEQQAAIEKAAAYREAAEAQQRLMEAERAKMEATDGLNEEEKEQLANMAARIAGLKSQAISEDAAADAAAAAIKQGEKQTEIARKAVDVAKKRVEVAKEEKDALEDQIESQDKDTDSKDKNTKASQRNTQSKQDSEQASRDLAEALEEQRQADEEARKAAEEAAEAERERIAAMKEAADVAQREVESLRASLLKETGFDQEADLLSQLIELQTKRAELTKTIQDAEAAGNADLVAALNQQLALTEQINAVKVRNINDQYAQETADRELEATQQIAEATQQLTEVMEDAANERLAIEADHLAALDDLQATAEADRLAQKEAQSAALIEADTAYWDARKDHEQTSNDELRALRQTHLDELNTLEQEYQAAIVQEQEGLLQASESAQQDSAENIREFYAETAQQVEELNQEIAQSLVEVAEDLADDLADVAKDLAKDQQEAARDLTQDFAEADRDHLRNVEKLHRDLQDTLVERQRETQDTLVELEQERVQKSEELHQDSAESATEAASDYQEKLAELQTDLSDRLADNTKDFNKSIQEENESLAKSLVEQQQKTTDQLNELVQKAAETTEELQQKAAQSVQDFNQDVVGLNQDVAKDIDKLNKDVAKDIEKLNKESSKDIEKLNREVAKEIDDLNQEASQSLLELNADVAQSIESLYADSKQAIADIQQDFIDSTKDLQNQFVQDALDATQTLADRSETLRRSLLGEQGETGQVLDAEFGDELQSLAKLYAESGDQAKDSFALAVEQARELYALQLDEMLKSGELSKKQYNEAQASMQERLALTQQLVDEQKDLLAKDQNEQLAQLSAERARLLAEQKAESDEKRRSIEEEAALKSQALQDEKTEKLAALEAEKIEKLAAIQEEKAEKLATIQEEKIEKLATIQEEQAEKLVALQEEFAERARLLDEERVLKEQEFERDRQELLAEAEIRKQAIQEESNERKKALQEELNERQAKTQEEADLKAQKSAKEHQEKLADIQKELEAKLAANETDFEDQRQKALNEEALDLAKEQRKTQDKEAELQENLSYKKQQLEEEYQLELQNLQALANEKRLSLQQEADEKKAAIKVEKAEAIQALQEESAAKKAQLDLELRDTLAALEQESQARLEALRQEAQLKKADVLSEQSTAIADLQRESNAKIEVLRQEHSEQQKLLAQEHSAALRQIDDTYHAELQLLNQKTQAELAEAKKKADQSVLIAQSNIDTIEQQIEFELALARSKDLQAESQVRLNASMKETLTLTKTIKDEMNALAQSNLAGLSQQAYDLNQTLKSIHEVL